MAKTLDLSLTAREAAAIRDALQDAAIALRTNNFTSVVIAEADFLKSDISQGRRERYEILNDYAEELAKFVEAAHD